MEPLFEKLKSNAIANRQRIVLPGIADIMLIGDKAEIMAKAAELGLKNIDKATVVNPNDPEAVEKYAQLFYELRKAKGVTIEDARKKVLDPLYLGCLLIKAGDADGQVAGAMNTTGNVLRAAFQVLKTAPGISTVSGAFLMLLPEGSPYGHNGVMVFADCAVVPDPDAQQLAQIAVSADRTARALAEIDDPKIAMLSFSTKGSAKHERVDKVVEATRLAKEMNPNLKIDGELQADAAGAKAVGPVLQGLAAPVNDLSRGCNEDDIYRTVILTCNQAINR